jgi:hypothetical protein
VNREVQEILKRDDAGTSEVLAGGGEAKPRKALKV